jgi:uncharacterized protein (TIGR02001 family)
MPTHRFAVLAIAPLAAALLAPAAASAQDEDAALKVSGTAAFVTDYRFRGISFSDLDPAVQASITLTTAPGLFFSAWGSSISDFNGATTEIDLTAGWSGDIAGLTTTVGGIYYTYPGGSNTNVFEFFGTLGIPLGPVTATFGLNWAPDQDNIRTSNRYAFGQLTAAIPGTPITVKGILGNERGGLVFDDSGTKTHKWDWTIGADVTWTALTFGVAYIGNNLTNNEYQGSRFNRTAQETVVFSVTAAF